MAMHYPTDDLRIKWTKVVLPPVFLEEEMPVTERVGHGLSGARIGICASWRAGPRLLVVVGPCSIHDTREAREYARLLEGSDRRTFDASCTS